MRVPMSFVAVSSGVAVVISSTFPILSVANLVGRSVRLSRYLSVAEERR